MCFCRNRDRDNNDMPNTRARTCIWLIALQLIISCAVLYYWISHQSYEGEDIPVKKNIKAKSSPRSSRLQSLQDKLKQINTNSEESNLIIVDIWGKASVGTYLWEHIFKASYIEKADIYSYGEYETNGILFRFHRGAGLTFDSIERSNESFKNVLLVINNVTPELRANAERWFNFTCSLKSVHNIGIILHGNESCDNEFVEKYFVEGSHDRLQVKSFNDEYGFKQKLRFMFVVYDSSAVDDRRIFQFPLGVATYRDFPVISDNQINNPYLKQRRYICNFIGTIYGPNTSRYRLDQILQSINTQQQCFVKTRNEWVSSETNESLNTYIDILADSDLTLSPVGINTECYRIYEALSLGSVPVIEDVSTNERCGRKSTGAVWNKEQDSEEKGADTTHMLRSLKRHKAPVIYVKTWNELPALLEYERSLSVASKVERRKRVLEWYKKFKKIMGDKLLNLIKKNMLPKVN